MDATSVGIALGLVFSSAYALLRMWAKLGFELGQTVLIFLAAFSVPGGVALIGAGLIGNPAELPSSWREYVSVAGIVAIGLAVHHVAIAFSASWQAGAAGSFSSMTSRGTKQKSDESTGKTN